MRLAVFPVTISIMEMLKRALGFGVGLACWLVSFPAHPSSPLTVSGAVHDELGRPLAQAEVLLFATEPVFSRLIREVNGAEPPPPLLSTRSGEGGRFALEVPEPGMWRLEVKAPGRVSVTQALEPLLEPQELAAAVLRPDVGAQLTVRSAKGHPVASARVRLLPFWGRTELWGIGWKAVERRGSTGADGTVRLPSAAGEVLGAEARANGFQPASHYNLERSISEVSLAKAVTRPIRVVDSNGAPAAGVLVIPGEGSAFELSDANGLCNVIVSPQGTTTLRFLAANGQTGRGEVGPLERRERQPPSFRLTAPRKLAGQVVYGESNEPASGAWVWSDADPAGYVVADSRGNFELPTPGLLSLQSIKATQVGFFPVQAEATEFERRREPLVLEPLSAIYGRVVDESGAPLAGAEATLIRQGSANLRRMGRDSGSSAATTAADGRFRLAAVANELYQLEVKLEGFVPWSRNVSPGRKAERVVLSRGRTLAGQVLGADGEPLAGARLTLVKSEEAVTLVSFSRRRRVPEAPPSTTSEGEGRFLLQRIAAGTYHLDIEAAGHAPFRRLAFEVPAGTGRMDLGQLRLEGGVSLSGRVVDLAGTPVPGALLKLEDRAWQPGEPGSGTGEMALLRRFQQLPGQGPPTQVEKTEIRSNAEGEFTLQGLAAGERVTVVAELEGYATARAVAVEAPAAEPLVLVLERRATISGVVVDERGRPIGGAMVSVQDGDPGQRDNFVVQYRGDGFASEDRLTDESGRFERQGVGPGRLKVEAQAEGYLSTSRWVEVGPGATLEGLRLVLTLGAILEGRVTTTDGAPVAMAFVTTMESGLSLSFSTSASSDEDGRYRLTGLALGEQLVECQVIQSSARTRKQLTIAAGVNQLDFVLQEGGGQTITGRVIDAAGTPVAGAMVMLQGGNRMAPNNDTSRADGSFRIEHLSDGIYAVRAFKDALVMANPDLKVEIAGRAVDGLVVELSAGARIEGRVLGLEPRRFPAVAIEAAGGTLRWGFNSVGVDSDGAFTLPNLLPGGYTVTARDGIGGRSVDATATLAPGEESTFLELDFGAGLTLSGWVKVGNTPVADAELSVSGLDVSSHASARTSHQGRFELGGLETGRYRVSIYLAGAATSTDEEVTLTGDEERTFEIETGRVSGRVTEAATGRAVPGAQLALISSQGEVTFQSAPRDVHAADSEGVFDLGEIAAGSYKLRAVKPGYQSVDREIEVRSGGREQVELELERATELVIVISSALGGTPDWVQVAALDSNGRRVLYDNLFTDQAGQGRIDRLPPGSYTLLVGTTNTSFVEVEATVPGPALPVFLPLGSTFVLEVPALAGEATLAKVSLFDAGGKPFRSAARGDAAGEWPVSSGAARISNLRPGLWRVVVTAPDGRVWETTTEAPTTGGTLRVRVE